MRFAKGHGTGNDFVLLPDPDDRLALSAGLVAGLCDRHTGLGADGVLRAVRQPPGGSGWFMDYRNADGSVAEMCGNGIRVFVRYLLDQGLASGPVTDVTTRAGVRRVREEADGQLTVDMGAVTMLGAGSAMIGGRRCEGLAMSVGNPHLACLVADPVAGFDLSSAPRIDPVQFPDGANVEVLRITGPRQLEMAVHERGSGRTLSCGTGAVAAAAAAAAATGQWPDLVPGPWVVEVPGGRLAVTPGVTASLLTGPAVIVAEGVLDSAWLANQAAVSAAV